MADDALTTVLQENLLTLLCFDDKHAPIIRSLVPVEDFEGLYREIAGGVYTYVDTHKHAPKTHLADIFDYILEGKDKRKAGQYRRVLKFLNETKGDVNPEFVMRRLSQYSRHQRLKRATMDLIEVFQGGRVDDEAMARIESILAEAMRKKDVSFDPGVRLGDKARSLQYLDRDDSDVFLTGIKEFDEFGLGPYRKALHLFIGLRKTGKTWWMVNLGKNAFLEGRKVLHISLEMDEERMVQRYHQALFAMCKRRPTTRQEALWYRRFKLDDLGRLVGIRRRRLKPKISLDDPKVRRELAKRIDRFGARLDRIRIKSFPTRQLTYGELVAYLDCLEMQEGFIPDLLLVDYPQLMKLDLRDLRIQLGALTADLRGLGVERNMAVAIVSQTRRPRTQGGQGKQVSRVPVWTTGGDIGEDFTQNMTADTILTYSQTEMEASHGLARIRVDAARDEMDKWAVLVAQSYATGQFCLQSVRMVDHYWDVLDRYEQRHKGDED